MQQTIMRLPAVCERTGLARTQLYAAVKAGKFPRQVPIGIRTVGWLESEVDAWIAARAGERDKK